jgi:hypothetical protein
MGSDYSGCATVLLGAEWREHRLAVSVRCLVGAHRRTVQALIDTASELSVLDSVTASLLADELAMDGETVVLDTRLGFFRGVMARVQVEVPQERGEALSIEATFFVSPDWPGPTVLGWEGALSRFRFGIDPEGEWFYFAPL